MKTCYITLSPQGLKVLSQIREKNPEGEFFVHELVESPGWARKFSKLVDLAGRIFHEYEGLVFVAPCGAVARAVGPLARDKKTDPAVVAVDVGGRYAISLLGGHEGGANDLALAVANAIGAEPVISTTTEAVKSLIVGVGLRRGRPAQNVASAVREALSEISAGPEDVRILASVDIKSDEAGLLEAARVLGLPLRFISSEEIRQTFREFDHSEFVWSEVNLPAVAEPCALLAGRRTKLILKRKKYGGVTVAVAKENCSSLE